MSLKQQLNELFRKRFGLELDELTSARVEELARRQAEARRLDDWLGELRDADPGSVPVRAAVSVATNGQTYFMRDRPQLASLEFWLQSRHRELARPLHVWSAGCSTGEEAYTLSILGARLGVPLVITASDLNAEALERARRGVYSEWALRHVLEPERVAHFSASNGGKAEFQVASEVRTPIHFRLHNLASSQPLLPSRLDRLWDLILCRNVLIYFDRQVRARVIAEFEANLRLGGALVLSSSESLRALNTGLKTRQVGNGFLFIRELAEPAQAETGDRRSTLPPMPASAQSSFPPGGFPEPAPTSTKHLLDAGNRHLREHSFSLALELYAKATELDGISFEPYLLQAIVQLKQGIFSGAKSSLRSALFLEPRLWSAEYLLAGIFAREARRAEQVSALVRAESLLIREEPAASFVSDTAGIEPICYNREQALSLCRDRLKTIRKGTV